MAYINGNDDFLIALKGDKGDKGDSGVTPHIGANGNWFIDGEDTLQQAQGIQGEVGNGISSIALTKTEGLVDTYKIVFSDGSEYTFTVTNGEDGECVTIESIEKTSLFLACTP